MQPSASARQCVRGHPLVGDGLFCQSCGAFQLDAEGSVEMGGRGMRLVAWLVNAVIAFLLLFIGWVIWWFIVAPRGQNPGKAVVGLRVIQTDGGAMNTGTMFVRGLVGWVASLIPLGFFVDSAWLLWDKDAQTIHDKVVNTVVVKAKGSAKIVETGGLPSPAGGITPRPPTRRRSRFPARRPRSQRRRRGGRTKSSAATAGRR